MAEGYEPAFQSLSSLIQHFKAHALFNAQDMPYTLKYPFTPSPPVPAVPETHNDSHLGEPWFYGDLSYEAACAILQYETDGCYLIRRRLAAARTPPVGSPTVPEAVCELVYVHEGRPYSKDIEITKRGVRFQGGHSYFEDLEVLVLSYAASPGDELRCALTHAPGHPPTAGLNRDADISMLDAFALDARVRQRRRARKVRNVCTIASTLCPTSCPTDATPVATLLFHPPSAFFPFPSERGLQQYGAFLRFRCKSG